MKSNVLFSRYLDFCIEHISKRHDNLGRKKNCLRSLIFIQMVRLKYCFKELLTLIETNIEKLQKLGHLAGMGNRVQNILNNRLNSNLRLYN